MPVFFVGSIKPNKEKRNAYPLSFVWQVESDEDGDINMTKINLKKVSKYNIPLEFSINCWGIEKMMKKSPRELSAVGLVMYEKWKDDKEAYEKEKTENDAKYKPSEDEIHNINCSMGEFMSLLGKVLDGLDDTRAVETRSWFGVLKVCKNLCVVYGLDQDKVVDMFDKFSQRGGERYCGRDAVVDKFGAIEGKGYMGLLWHWLKDDNMPVFKKCIREFYNIRLTLGLYEESISA